MIDSRIESPLDSGSGMLRGDRIGLGSNIGHPLRGDLLGDSADDAGQFGINSVRRRTGFGHRDGGRIV